MATKKTTRRKKKTSPPIPINPATIYANDTEVIVTNCGNSTVPKNSKGVITGVYNTTEMSGYSVAVKGIGEIFVEFGDVKLIPINMTWGDLKKLNEKTSDNTEIVICIGETTVQAVRAIIASEQFMIIEGAKEV